MRARGISAAVSSASSSAMERRTPPVEDERRHAYGRQHLAQVRLEERPDECIGDLGARADAQPIGEPAPTLLVRVERRAPCLEQLIGPGAGHPALAQLAELFLDLAIVGSRPVRDRMEEHERPRPLGIGRRVQGGHPPPLMRAEHDGARGADCVEHRAQVLHPKTRFDRLASGHELGRGVLAPLRRVGGADDGRHRLLRRAGAGGGRAARRACGRERSRGDSRREGDRPARDRDRHVAGDARAGARARRRDRRRARAPPDRHARAPRSPSPQR